MFHPPRKYRHRDVQGHPLRPETLMMGYGYDPQFSEGAVKCPIFQTSTFTFKTAEDGKSFFQLAYGLREQGPAEEPGLIYSRVNNPDLEILEERLGLWDEAESGLAFSSGMAAISTTMFSVLRPGDVLLASAPVYGGTEFLIENILPQFGIKRVWFGAGSLEPGLADAVETARGLGRVGLIYVETPANPTNGLVDIAACAAAARSLRNADGRRPLVAVDNTFLGPLWQRPLRHGADFVIYSLTKYVGGHSDLIAGACLGTESAIAPVRGLRTILGTIADPHTCWLLLRSLETLKLRMTGSMENARRVAEFLAGHPKVKAVHYLGFLGPADPQLGLYQRQCEAPGSTFSFEVDGGEAEAFRLLNRLEVIKLAVSLGGTESLIEHPATMTHSDIPPGRQLEMGITPSMVRLSVGLEHPEDLIADLRQALAGI
ncbi:MAG TPA: cystathionine gamma-synthase family protein [Vicinamibacterales bacterium]|nr:cystathionine gamma-synthase family protein [Vicinamibacterales bacterium]